MNALTVQATALVAQAAALPPTLRAPRVAVRLSLRAWSARAYVSSALLEFGWQNIGSQRYNGADVVLMAANDAALVNLVETSKQFLGRLAAITSLELCTPVVRLPVETGPSDDASWFEAVLHPRLDAAPETALARFGAFAASVGGSLEPHQARIVSDLIFAPVRLPLGRASEAARYLPLRVVRPMPRIILLGDIGQD